MLNFMQHGEKKQSPICLNNSISIEFNIQAKKIQL